MEHRGEVRAATRTAAARKLRGPAGIQGPRSQSEAERWFQAPTAQVAAGGGPLAVTSRRVAGNRGAHLIDSAALWKDRRNAS